MHLIVLRTRGSGAIGKHLVLAQASFKTKTHGK
jgi:hypothetical protein